MTPCGWYVSVCLFLHLYCSCVYVCVCVWSEWVCDLTGVRSQSKGRGRAYSHRGDLDSGHQSNQGDTCHTEGPLCCAGSSVVGRTHWLFSYIDALQSSLKGTVGQVVGKKHFLVKS